MLRHLAFVLLAIALLAAACGGSGGAGESAIEDTLARTGAASATDAGPPAAQNGDSPTETASATDAGPPAAQNGDTEADTTALDNLFAGFDPFSMIGGLGQQEAIAGFASNVDPALMASLLEQSDLPAEFKFFEELGLADDVGGEMASRIFATNALNSDDPGTIVMSSQ